MKHQVNEKKYNETDNFLFNFCSFLFVNKIEIDIGKVNNLSDEKLKNMFVQK